MHGWFPLATACLRSTPVPAVLPPPCAWQQRPPSRHSVRARAVRHRRASLGLPGGAPGKPERGEEVAGRERTACGAGKHAQTAAACNYTARVFLASRWLKLRTFRRAGIATVRPCIELASPGNRARVLLLAVPTCAGNGLASSAIGGFEATRAVQKQSPRSEDFRCDAFGRIHIFRFATPAVRFSWLAKKALSGSAILYRSFRRSVRSS